jgi:hypothetical protein
MIALNATVMSIQFKTVMILSMHFTLIFYCGVIDFGMCHKKLIPKMFCYGVLITLHVQSLARVLYRHKQV